nr:acyl carrier protein [Corynebacterium lactis]
MTSSLGDQLSALLGGNSTATATPEGTAAGTKREPDEDLPAGVHGEVAAVVKSMAGDEVESLELSTPLSSYGFDRLAVVELAVRCEEELGVRIEDDDITTFRTLGDVVDYIAARRG